MSAQPAVDPAQPEPRPTSLQQVPGGPQTGPLPTPKLTRSNAPMDVHEWRQRWESRANTMMIIGIVLMLQSGITRTPWIAWVAIIGGPALIVAGICFRPRLPWAAPVGVRGSATGTDHEGRSTTGPFPVPGHTAAVPGARPGPARPVTAPLPTQPAAARYVPGPAPVPVAPYQPTP